MSYSTVIMLLLLAYVLALAFKASWYFPFGRHGAFWEVALQQMAGDSQRCALYFRSHGYHEEIVQFWYFLQRFFYAAANDVCIYINGGNAWTCGARTVFWRVVSKGAGESQKSSAAVEKIEGFLSSFWQ